MAVVQPILNVSPALQLRPMSAADAPELFRVVDTNRAHLRQWLPWLDRNTTEADSQSFIASTEVPAANGRAFVWAIESGGRICGVAGFNWIEPVNRVCEIGYWLAADQQGRGVMTACVRRLIDHAFDDLNINRITIPAAVGNHRSRAVPERLGFRAEGVLRQAEWLYDRFVDHVMYAVVKDDWTGKIAAAGACLPA